jgi:hypothetical protein
MNNEEPTIFNSRTKWQEAISIEFEISNRKEEDIPRG